MKNNRNKSCSAKSKHIDINYFFANDMVKSNKMSIEYCSTEHMLANLFTKSLQRALLSKCCDAIMGLTHVYTLQMVPPSTKAHVVNVVKVGSNKEVIESSMDIEVEDF